MERLGSKAYWKVKPTIYGDQILVTVAGRQVEFPPVHPDHVGKQVSAVRDILFIANPYITEFRLEDWDPWEFVK